ncbi:MAG: NADH-quinone oxidoreductase subunit NuoN [Burkholderiales bacterium]|jgi:NADH-quinone oxidoreductase subunit N|nr:NADH-quinone oxidoreductase subunit NuoN [Burkholderiales bacterium]
MNISLFAAIPEIFVTVMLVIMLLIDAFINEKKKAVNTIWTFLTLIGGFILQIYVYTPGKVQLAFNNMFILDSMAQGMKLFTYISGIMVLLYIKRYVIDKQLLKSELYAIYLFAILGMLVMISADNLLILYVGLELLSLALYGLVAIDRDNVKSTEAAMKFFILGALSSGLLLYGISFIYGATNGNLQLELVFQEITQLTQNHINSPSLVFGLVFIVAGLTFKLGLVPFHMWVPDVYEGSTLAVTTIIGTVTKLASVVFIIRFLVGGLSVLGPHWSLMLSVLAFLSLFVGNIVAIAQTNIKRMLGYSAIAQMGFIAFGLMTFSVDGLSAIIFYIVTYVLTSLAGFGALLMLSRNKYECEKIEDLKGLNKSHPIYAGILLLVMFSLAGVPPLVGFYAKLKILEALIAAGFLRSAIFIVIMSLIAAFYYLRIVKVMYFDEQEVEIITADNCLLSKTVLVLNGLSLLVLGIIPEYLMNYCLRVITG